MMGGYRVRWSHVMRPWPDPNRPWESGEIVRLVPMHFGYEIRNGPGRITILRLIRCYDKSTVNVFVSRNNAHVIAHIEPPWSENARALGVDLLRRLKDGKIPPGDYVPCPICKREGQCPCCNGTGLVERPNREKE